MEDWIVGAWLAVGIAAVVAVMMYMDRRNQLTDGSDDGPEPWF